MSNYPTIDDKLATLRHAIEGGVKADSMQAMKLMELVDAIGEQFKLEVADVSAPAVNAGDLLSKVDDLLYIAGRCAGKLKASLTRGEVSPRMEFEQLAEKYSEIIDLRSALRDETSIKPQTSTEKVWPVPLSMDHGHIIEHAVELRFESEEDADDFFEMYSVAAGNTAPCAASGQKLTVEQCEVLLWCENYHARRVGEGNYHFRIANVISNLLRASDSATASDKEAS